MKLHRASFTTVFRAVAFTILLIVFYSNRSACSDYSIAVKKLSVRDLPEVTCYFTVIDDHNQNVIGLLPNEINAYVDGIELKDLKLESVGKSEKDAIALVLVLDKSGSMKGEFFNKSIQAATSFLDRLSSFDETAIVSFDSKVIVSSQFTSDINALKSSINKLGVGSDTALNDAVSQALDLLAHSKLERKAVIVLTDGKDNRSRMSADDLYTQAQVSSIPVYTIGLGKNIDQLHLEKLALLSGGKYFFAPDASELLNLYRGIADEFQNIYRLSYTNPQGEDKQWHTLKITTTLQGKKYSIEKKYLSSSVNQLDAQQINKYGRSANSRPLMLVVLIGFIIGSAIGSVIIFVRTLTGASFLEQKYVNLAVLVFFIALGIVATVTMDYFQIISFVNH